MTDTVEAPEKTGKETSRKAGRKQQVRGLERRRLIMEVTRELLEYTSTSELSLYQVAEKSGIPPSSVYHFFPKTDVLFQALVEEIFTEFDAILEQPLQTDEIHHWSDIFRQLQQRFVACYRENKYVRDLILGQHVVSSIRHADYEHDNQLGCRIHGHHQQFFQLPPLPQTYNIFAIALQIADKVYSISHQEHGNITDTMAQEGLRASLAYLGLYLPQQMMRQP
ncbi:TetR/AcrR family transcriptional regulator [Spongorhabdus nitratireducens]